MYSLQSIPRDTSASVNIVLFSVEHLRMILQHVFRASFWTPLQKEVLELLLETPPTPFPAMLAPMQASRWKTSTRQTDA